ncbi:ArpU family phage packaging/lysis transcriptional regulator [Saccharibacillus sp. CPCC 101409]|uniref:ArpU family phage packaging/lysis transcriptional regulator n=1 Tax=Saccharibacillus sp. CPCC 101409 TaxID=3058041 RepID=UPI002672548C|nr:ArpU family phage packaging/lysis transcriptional regulator [Saccharibacillus sp. CPCC 101409]MDO3408539.1 ArpU family phage packaging/lysis transcriptional regulator [Saccharibacillus sp. CPCC 101409]
MNDALNLPKLDRRKTQAAIEAAMEKYRIYKTITFEEKESRLTASYSDVPSGYTGVTSDPTARTAVYNVDMPAARAAYCERIERIVERLNERERLLVRERYMKQDDVFDYKVYNQVFDPPVSKDTYVKVRSGAFYKMALSLSAMGMLPLDDLLAKSKEGGGRRTDKRA